MARKAAVAWLLCIVAFVQCTQSMPDHHTLLSLRGGSAGDINPRGFAAAESQHGTGGPGEGEGGGSVAVPAGDRMPRGSRSDPGIKRAGGLPDRHELLNMPISSEQAEELRSRGILRGRWTAESEEEPTSDIMDAAQCDGTAWPDEWGGEEENDDVVAHTRGPVKIFGHTKYNRDVLPEGKVSDATLKRLERSIASDAPSEYAKVTIVEGDEDLVSGNDGDREEEESSAPPMPGSSMASGGPKPAPMMKLPKGVSKGMAQMWLDQLAAHNKPKGRGGVSSNSLPELDIKAKMTPRRRVAEKALDNAIQADNPEELERALDMLKLLDAEEGAAGESQ